MVDQLYILNEQGKNPEHINLDQRFGGAQDQLEGGEKQEQKVEQVSERVIAESGAVYGHILAQVHTAQKDDHGKVMQDASSLHQKMDRESQIKHLIDLAMTDGVQHAVKVAQQAEDYYILDQIHDRLLAEDLHAALLTKGLIEQ